MKYLKINTDLVDYTSALSDAEIGRLFVALLEYAESGVEQELTGNERFLWAVAKSQIHVHDSLNNGKKGEDHWNWKGGITPKNQKGRASVEYKEWRAAVFERDHYTCQVCRKVGGVLNAHHIIPWAKDLEKRYDIENGITLCKACHSSIHRRK